MSLLREIQDAAINADVGLPTLLRKCKVLAARLGNEEFKNWVENELNGYDSTDDLPEYRILHVNSKGHFSGPFNSGLRNADIPMICIPEEFRDPLSVSNLGAPIAALESLLEDSDSGVATEPWNPSLVAHLGQNIYEGMNCMQAWKVIPLAGVVAALDAVRNRILSFVLEIEAEDPNAGDAPVNSNPIPQERVHQIFNTYITGNVQNVASGGSRFEQNATYSEAPPEVIQQLLQSIDAAPQEQGQDEIKAVAEELRDTYGSSDFKGAYQRFMSALADHMQVWGPVVAPHLPALAAIVP